MYLLNESHLNMVFDQKLVVNKLKGKLIKAKL